MIFKCQSSSFKTYNAMMMEWSGRAWNYIKIF